MNILHALLTKTCDFLGGYVEYGRDNNAIGNFHQQSMILCAEFETKLQHHLDKTVWHVHLTIPGA